MVFSSPVFLFAFLPLVLGAYWTCPRRARNFILIAASLVFYAWGEKQYLALLVLLALGNWAAGLWIARAPGSRWRIGLAVAANVLALAIFKYSSFVITNINDALGWSIPALPVHLPAGLSFVTFQAISYLIDIRRGHAPVESSPGRYSLYATLFPHLVAGPIVRYRDLAGQLHERVHTFDNLAAGVQRFIIGLGKKVLIADSLRTVADDVFQLSAADRGCAVAWLGLIAFSLQIYFDFSGYSDMAIGLGRMFGFRFAENFRYPYAARSLGDFWRRWHITLSSWLRDYVYIPLGGNRRRVTRNLIATFAICGLWHGAGWTFVAWGLWHGAMLALERTTGRSLGRAGVWLVVAAGWVLFRSPTLAAAGEYFEALSGLTNGNVGAVGYLNGEFLLAMAAGIFAAGPLAIRLRRLRPRMNLAGASLELAGSLAILVSSCLTLVGGTYQPFLYFRF